jgi:hypothetical protein
MYRFELALENDIKHTFHMEPVHSRQQLYAWCASPSVCNALSLAYHVLSASISSVYPGFC